MSWLFVIGAKNALLCLPLALVALAAGRWPGRPALTHLLWVLVLVKLLTPPLVDVPLGWRIDVESWIGGRTVEGRGSRVEGNANGRVVSGDGQVKTRALAAIPRVAANAPPALVPRPSTLVPRPSVTQLLSAIWLLGSLFAAARLVWSSRRFHRYLSRVEQRHEHLGPRAAELAASVGIAIAPRVIVVDSVVSPMLWGMGRRACLVFPAGLIGRLSRQQLDALLLHELAHFHRGDNWVRALELAAGVLFWWHPVVWCARRELEAAEEQCCDMWVIERSTGVREPYARAIVATIDFLHEPAAVLPPAACGLAGLPLLRARLTQIMRGQGSSRLPLVFHLAVLGFGLMLSPLEPALWASPSPVIHSSSSRSQVPAPLPRIPGVTPARNDSTNRAVATVVSTPARRSPAHGPSSSRFVLPPLRWATAQSPSGRYRLEAQAGRRVALSRADMQFRLDLSSHRITSAAFTPDSRTFLTGHEDAVVRRWDSETGGLLQAYRGCDSTVNSVAVNPAGDRVAAGTSGGVAVVWDIATGDEVARLDTQAAAVACLRWSHRGDRLAISVGDWSEHDWGGVLVWSPAENVVQMQTNLAQSVGAICWLAGDDALIVAAWDGSAQVRRAGSGEVLSELQFNKDEVSAAAWSPNCALAGVSLTDLPRFAYP